MEKRKLSRMKIEVVGADRASCVRLLRSMIEEILGGDPIDGYHVSISTVCGSASCDYDTIAADATKEGGGEK